jgi:DNA helicase-2/ATP-dependent DNA helicase PcrA
VGESGEDREAVLDPEFGPVQQEVVDSDLPALIVEGPPGSGKSRALRWRVVRLAGEGEPVSTVAMVVPTRLAREVNRNRLQQILPTPYDELVVETPSSLAERLLRRMAPAAGLDPDFRVVGRAERLAMLRVRFDELPIRAHRIRGNPSGLLRLLLGRIDRLKAWPAGLAGADLGDTELATELEALLEFHDRMLEDAGCLDQWDLCRIGTGLFGAVSGPPTAGAPAHLVVDGLEALSPVESGLLDAISGGTRTAVVTFDGFGAPASPENLVPDLAGRAETVAFERAWRMGPGQIAAARAVLGSSDRDSAEWLPGEGGSPIRFWQAASQRAEAQATAREIERMLADGGSAESAVVVVGDPDRDGPVVQAALLERGIGSAVSGGSVFFREPEVRDAVAWLRILLDPGDSTAVARVLVRPPVEIRPPDLAQLTKIARRRKIDLIEASTAALDSPRISPESRERLGSFLGLYRAAAGALDNYRPDAFVRRLIERVGLRREALFSARPETAERLIGLARLAQVATEWSLREPDGSAREFAAFAAAMAESGLEPSNGPRVPKQGKVRIIARREVRAGHWRKAFLLGLDRTTGSDRQALASAFSCASEETVLSRVGPAGEPGPESDPDLPFEAALEATGGEVEPVEEELFGPAEDLQSAYRLLRDEVMESSWGIGRELVEPRLDTTEDLNRAVARYLELLKLAALAQRPDGTADREAIEAVNGLLAQVASPEQRAEIEASSLDPSLIAAESERELRQALVDSRTEPSLDAFLPRSGGRLRLSATDLDLYLSCPLRYKFARVFGIPTPKTVNQRFGILIHDLLERFHRDGGQASADQLVATMEAGWEKAGLEDSADEIQFRERARGALARYCEAEASVQSEPLWLERKFELDLGPYRVTGRVDRVDRRPDGEIELIDYKTGAAVDPERLGGDVQLTLYRLAAERAWGVDPSVLTYYYVMEPARVEVESGPEDLERVERTVAEVGEAILAQDFEPTPSPSTCAWCDFRTVCPAAEA